MLSIANKKALVVAISGGSGSGKTTIAHRLREYMPEGVRSVVIYQDNYYKDQKEVPLAKRLNNNYDTPTAFDWSLMKHDLEALRNKRPIDSPVYDFTNHTRSLQKEHVEPVDVVIFEGFMALHANILHLSDIRLFVDTPSDERLLRRMMRDIKERGRSFESIANQWRFTVRPMYRAHVAPQKEVAHIIIPWYEISSVAIKAIKGAIVDFINAPNDETAKHAPLADGLKAAEEEVNASIEADARAGMEVLQLHKKVETNADAHGNAVPGRMNVSQRKPDLAARQAQSLAAKQRHLEQKQAAALAAKGHAEQQNAVLPVRNQPKPSQPGPDNRPASQQGSDKQRPEAGTRPRAVVPQQFKNPPKPRSEFSRNPRHQRNEKPKPTPPHADKTDQGGDPEPEFGY